MRATQPGAGHTVAPSGKTHAVRDVEVHYAVRNGDSLAFEVFGDGPHDVVVRQGACPIDLMWDLPQLAAFMERLGGFARVIAYDARGQGASDPILDPAAAGAEVACDDLLCVLDAAGSERATIFDMNLGTAPVLFAAMYPQRVRSLIIVNLRSSFPELQGMSAEQRTSLGRALTTTKSLRVENPRVAHDPILQQWWGRARRLMNSPAGPHANSSGPRASTSSLRCRQCAFPHSCCIDARTISGTSGRVVRSRVASPGFGLSSFPAARTRSSSATRSRSWPRSSAFSIRRKQAQTIGCSRRCCSRTLWPRPSNSPALVMRRGGMSWTSMTARWIVQLPRTVDVSSRARRWILGNVRRSR